MNLQNQLHFTGQSTAVFKSKATVASSQKFRIARWQGALAQWLEGGLRCAHDRTRFKSLAEFSG